MLLSEEEIDLINQISSKIGCVTCKTISNQCFTLLCGHNLCFACNQQFGSKCSKSDCVENKSPNHVASIPLVRDIADAFEKFRQSIADELRTKENVHDTVNSLVVQELSPPKEIVSHFTESSQRSVMSEDSKESAILTEARPKPQVIETQIESFEETMCHMPSILSQSQAIMHIEDSSSLPALSNTCGDWLNEIQHTKAAIERLIAGDDDNDMTLPNTQTSVNSFYHDKVSSSFTETQVTTVALPIIAEYRLQDTPLLLDRCAVKGWITFGDGRNITISDESKLCVVESIYHNEKGYIGKRSLLYMKALLLGFTIVDIDWLRDSLAQNVLLDPLFYQVVGVTTDTFDNLAANQNLEEDHIKYRPTEAVNYSSLFSAYAFSITDSHDEEWNSKIKEEVIWMISAGGGKIITANDLADPSRAYLINIHLQLKSKYPTVYLDTSFENESPDESHEDAVVNPPSMSRKLISVSWMFEAICSGQIPSSFDPYFV